MNGRCLPSSRLEVSTFSADSRLSDASIADMKFVLLHEGKNDDGIKAFFMDVWELYVKVRVKKQFAVV